MTDILDGQDFYDKLIPDSVDFSVQRDEEIQDVFDNIPFLLTLEKTFAKPHDKSQMKQIDSYKTYAKKQVLVDLSTVPRAGLAVGVLKNPIVVFRDFMEKPDTREGTQVEYFFGVLLNPIGRPIYVLAMVQRNVMVSVLTSEDEQELLERIAGLRFYKGYTI